MWDDFFNFFDEKVYEITKGDKKINSKLFNKERVFKWLKDPYKQFRAISIRNPWADLIARGVKDIENRTWTIKALNEPVFIQTTFTIEDHLIIPYRKKYGNLIKDFDYYVRQRQKIIGCFWVDNFNDSDSEWAIKGQRHWNISNVLRFENTFPCKGRLSLWSIPDELHENLKYEVAICLDKI